MNLKLRRGKPSARIVSPGKTLEKKDKAALHTVTVPGASCKAGAKRGRKRLSLGSARAKRNGSVRFSGALARRLRSGRWQVKVSCSYRSKGRRGKAHASSSVKVV
jgi:hypothetical protein